MEAFGLLVLPPVFKTGEAENLGLEGSIPFRLRHSKFGDTGHRSPGTSFTLPLARTRVLRSRSW
jgi:hypothetical protein